MDRHVTRIQESVWRLRPKIPTATHIFSGALNPKHVCPTQIDNDHCKKQNAAKQNEIQWSISRWWIPCSLFGHWP